MVNMPERVILFRYNVTLTRDVSGKYIISHECLSTQNATSRCESVNVLYEVSGGEFMFISSTNEQTDLSKRIQNKTMNLLETATLSALFYEKFLLSEMKNAEYHKGILWGGLCLLYLLGKNACVFGPVR